MIRRQVGIDRPRRRRSLCRRSVTRRRAIRSRRRLFEYCLRLKNIGCRLQMFQWHRPRRGVRPHVAFNPCETIDHLFDGALNGFEVILSEALGLPDFSDVTLDGHNGVRRACLMRTALPLRRAGTITLTAISSG